MLALRSSLGRCAVTRPAMKALAPAHWVSVARVVTRAATPSYSAYSAGGSSAKWSSTAGGGADADDEASGTSVAEPQPSVGYTFAHLGIYKGKGAMQLKVIPPTWSQTPKGGWQVEREGVVFLEFASVAAGQGAQSSYGARSYGWDKKVTFGVKAIEAGAICCDHPGLRVGGKGLNMVHDPSKGGADEGKSIKTFSISAANEDGSHFFNMSQKGSSGDVRVSVPVTMGEMATIKKVLDFAIPRLLGFDVVLDMAGPNRG